MTTHSDAPTAHPDQVQHATYGYFAGYLIKTVKRRGEYTVEAYPNGETLATIRMYGFATFFAAVRAMKDEILSLLTTTEL